MTDHSSTSFSQNRADDDSAATVVSLGNNGWSETTRKEAVGAQVNFQPNFLGGQKADNELFEPGQVVDGKYRIIDKLGQGGMGVVYRVHHLGLDRSMALKTLNGYQGNRSHWLRFEREARVCARLEHPNLVKIFDMGLLADGMPFYTMELLDGTNLEDIIKRCGPLNFQTFLGVFLPVVRALDYAHSQGLVHRDIKPGNIVVDLDSSGKVQGVKLLDFGLVKEAVDIDLLGLTRVGEIMGTPAYLSPEQAAGEKIDGRSDLYSLGCCMFKATTGKAPYIGANSMAVLSLHVNSPLPKIGQRELIHDYPQDLEAVIARCMARKPEKRYSDARELLADLTALMADQALPLPVASASVAAAANLAAARALTADGGKARPLPGAGAKLKLSLALLLAILAVSALLGWVVWSSLSRPRMAAVSTAEPGAEAAKSAFYQQMDVALVNKEKHLAELGVHNRDLPAEVIAASGKGLVGQTPFSQVVVDKFGNKVRQFSFDPGAAPLGEVYIDEMGSFPAAGSFSAQAERGFAFTATKSLPACRQFLSRIDPDGLVRLDLSLCSSFGDADAVLLERFANLAEIDFTDTVVTGKSIASLGKLKKLKRLCITESKIAGEDLARLPNLAQLREVTASRLTRPTPFLRALKNSGAVHDLRLRNCQLTNDDLKALAALKNLSALDIMGPNIYDEKGVAALASSASISDLNLTLAKLPPTIGPSLARMKNLRRFRFQPTNWNDADIAELRRSLPPTIHWEGFNASEKEMKMMVDVLTDGG